jgi:FlaA1/EpsC-like NDP-sugar epimerase
MPLLVRPLLNRAFGLYAHSWRHVSVPELIRLGMAVAVGTILLLAVFLVAALFIPRLWTASHDRSGCWRRS